MKHTIRFALRTSTTAVDTVEVSGGSIAEVWANFRTEFGVGREVAYTEVVSPAVQPLVRLETV